MWNDNKTKSISKSFEIGALVCERQNIISFLFKTKGTLEVPAVEEIFATYVWPKTTENPHFCENKMDTNFDIVF